MNDTRMDDYRWKSDLNGLFNPKSIALVGASDKSYESQSFYHNLNAVGYTGKIFLVNPKRRELFGCKCYPNILEIPDPVDSVIVTIPARFVPQTMQECLEKGIRTGIINSSGFAEISVEGKMFQDKITEIAHQGQMRIVGPNTYGIANIRDKVAAISGSDVRYVTPGKIGLIIQSGGILNFMQMAAWDRGWGISYVVSCGNQAVLHIENYLEFLVKDDRTETIGIFAEEITDVQKFSEIADLAGKLGKPIVIIKIGQSAKGKKGAQAHTGSKTGSDKAYNTLFKEKGITRVHSLDGFIETIELFSKRKTLKGTRLGLMLPSGAECGYASDIANKKDLALPDLSLKAVERISKVQSPRLTISNPLNVPENYISNGDVFKECLSSFIEDENFDVIGIRLSLPRLRESKEVIARFINVVEAAKKTDKLLVLLSRGSVSLPEYWRKLLREHSLPFLWDYKRGFKAIKALMAYYRFLTTITK